jgi:hypothetical protein
VTEVEWLACPDPQKMLGFLRGQASERKLRLFACAFGRAVGDSQHQPGPSTVAVGERYADGLASDKELATERRKWACLPEERGPVTPSAYDGAWGAVDSLARYERAWRHDPDSRSCISADAVLRRSALLLRDIFGNPFRPVTTDSGWLTPRVVTPARTIYDDRAFDRLPILADALEEAGCTNADILAHCREPGPHVRGCWVVDLLLGKE